MSDAVKPQIVGRSVAYTGYLTVEKLHIQLADGTLVFRDIETHGDAAAVLPYDIERRCALVVRFFRAPFFSVTQEIAVEEACAGRIEKEDDEAAALPANMKGLRSLSARWVSWLVTSTRVGW